MCINILDNNVKFLNQEFLRADQGDRMSSAVENVHNLLLAVDLLSLVCTCENSSKFQVSSFDSGYFSGKLKDLSFLY